MSRRYNQNPIMTGATRFTKAPMVSVEYSRMVANPVWALPFNAGDIVPVYYTEILPHDTISLDLNFVIRQMTAQYPTMGQMQVDFFAYFVPNRIINESWKNVQGENTSGIWAAPEVALAPLYRPNLAPNVQIPVGSIADYYGFPTQAPIPANVLSACNDLKFRGYLEIFNTKFRDENFQPVIPYSKLNVYNGFLQPVGSETWLFKDNYVSAGTSADGSFGAGALVKATYGAGGQPKNEFNISTTLTSWSALDKPLKANKLHDFITSGLPSPQKGSEVYFGIGDIAPVDISLTDEPIDYRHGDYSKRFKLLFDGQNTSHYYNLLARFVEDTPSISTNHADVGVSNSPNPDDQIHADSFVHVNGFNIKAVTDLSQATGISVNDLRTAIATQQVYETLARGGSRYVETLRSFFEIETENPFLDIPTELGHIRRDLDLYQVAQTSASGATGTDTPQGELSAFGYTTNGGNLFTRTFLEHGYVHVLAVVRQRNMYSTYFAPDNFRLNTMDFYLPQFANIGEQPIRLATLNPFVDGALDKVIAYQEAWWEYRYEPDRVHGVFRSGVEGSLDVWHYGDPYDKNFEVVTGDWLKSNAEEVLNRTITTTSDLVPQFKGLFSWRVDKQRPMPTYSVPGLDIF